MAELRARILIIEDEKIMMDALDFKLSGAGYETVHAVDGNEGLALLDKESFDLVLLDLLMPKVDGFVVLGELQKKKNAPPIIVLTNLSQDEDERRAKELGAKGFFVRADTSMEGIVAEVKKVIGR